MVLRYVCLGLMTSYVYAETARPSDKASSPEEMDRGRPKPVYGGWLDRVVAYYKKEFVEDVIRTQGIQLDVTLEKAPEGYKDSPDWDEASVMRLISLVRQSASKGAKPVRHALRRVLKPILTRRMYYTPVNNRIMFPSLKKIAANQFYYSDTGEEMEPSVEYIDSYEEEERAKAAEKRKKKRWEESHRAVVVVRNPVEARLPSSRISLDLLRKIMEERALAARIAPTSTKVTLTWRPRHNSTQESTPSGEAETTDTSPPSNDSDQGKPADGKASDGGNASEDVDNASGVKNETDGGNVAGEDNNKNDGGNVADADNNDNNKGNVTGGDNKDDNNGGNVADGDNKDDNKGGNVAGGDNNDDNNGGNVAGGDNNDDNNGGNVAGGENNDDNNGGNEAGGDNAEGS